MARHNTAFSTQARLLMCQNCGAPIEAKILGGFSQCPFCDAQNRVLGRKQTLVGASVPTSPITEDERLSRLRAQVGREITLPPSIASLQEGGVIPKWKMQEALAVWKQTREEIEATGSPDAAERFLRLSELLSQTYG